MFLGEISTLLLYNNAMTLYVGVFTTIVFHLECDSGIPFSGGPRDFGMGETGWRWWGGGGGYY